MTGESVAGEDGASRGTILLVEDEPAVARLTELVLVSAGYTVVLAGGHVPARQMLAEIGFDLVIADTEMGARAPGLEGPAELAQAASSPVLLFSAHRFTQAQIEAAGLAGAIPKPFDIDELLAIVERTLTGSGPDGGGDASTSQS